MWQTARLSGLHNQLPCLPRGHLRCREAAPECSAAVRELSIQSERPANREHIVLYTFFHLYGKLLLYIYYIQDKDFLMLLLQQKILESCGMRGTITHYPEAFYLLTSKLTRHAFTPNYVPHQVSLTRSILSGICEFPIVTICIFKPSYQEYLHKYLIWNARIYHFIVDCENNKFIVVIFHNLYNRDNCKYSHELCGKSHLANLFTVAY